MIKLEDLKIGTNVIVSKGTPSESTGTYRGVAQFMSQENKVQILAIIELDRLSKGYIYTDEGNHQTGYITSVLVNPDYISIYNLLLKE